MCSPLICCNVNLALLNELLHTIVKNSNTMIDSNISDYQTERLTYFSIILIDKKSCKTLTGMKNMLYSTIMGTVCQSILQQSTKSFKLIGTLTSEWGLCTLFWGSIFFQLHNQFHLRVKKVCHLSDFWPCMPRKRIQRGIWSCNLIFCRYYF